MIPNHLLSALSFSTSQNTKKFTAKPGSPDKEISYKSLNKNIRTKKHSLSKTIQQNDYFTQETRFANKKKSTQFNHDKTTNDLN